MVLSRTDELAVAACRQCVDRCQERRINPAPYFPLLLRMYEELQAHGLIRKEEAPPVDVCDGCPAYRYSGCMNGYQMATLSLDGTKVTKCGYKRIAQTRSGGASGMPRPTEATTMEPCREPAEKKGAGW